MQPIHTPGTCGSHRLKLLLGQQHSLKETTMNTNVKYLEKNLKVWQTKQITLPSNLAA